jgi:hypothetical protein
MRELVILTNDVLGPAPAPPRRRPGSVRRTSSILMTWPDGIFNGLQLTGRCRDLLTPVDGEPVALGQHDLLARAGMDRTIQSVQSWPDVPTLRKLEGARAGGALRGSLAEVVPDLRDEGAPLYLLLDDLAGASLIAGFVWGLWRDHLPELSNLRDMIPKRSMQGICSGFRPGASSLNADGTMSGITHQIQVVPPLADADDPWSWHELADPPPMAMRRARRVDVWRDADELRIDGMFRDSAWEPDGVEIAVHEYRIDATADLDGVLTSIIAEPRVLPFDECPMAANNVDRMVGVSLADFRLEVLERIQDTDCCTHLNDALRSLAEVPVLAAALLEGERSEMAGPAGRG